MIRRVLALAAALAAAAVTSAAGYPIAGVLYGRPSGAPVLASVTVNIGANTQAGRGGVGLASIDVTKYGSPIKGLDVWTGNVAHTPTSWTVQDITSTSGYTPGSHFQVDPGSSSCTGATAVTINAANPPTPRPCSAGVTAALNKGPYQFRVTAKDAQGNTSSPVTLTYTIVANAANLGDQAADTVSSSIMPSSWTSSGAPSGAKILLSTGANWASDAKVAADQRLIFKNMDFTLGGGNQVTFQDADPARHGGLWEVELNYMKNFALNGLVITGPPDPPSGTGSVLIDATSSSSTHHSDTILLQDVSVIRQQADVANDDQTAGLYIKGWSNNVTVNNFKGRYLPYCANVTGSASNVTFNNTWCRYVYDNFFGVGNVSGLTLNDTYLIAAMRKDALHVDAFQVYDSDGPQNWTINRIMYVQADGNATAQGPIFGGRAGANTGWIDDGNGGPGTTLHILTRVQPNNSDLGVGGAFGVPIVSTPDSLGASVTAGTHTTSACTFSSSQVNTCQVDTAQLVGSASDPVTFYTAPWNNMQFNGVVYAGSIYNGFASHEESGTSFLKNFTYVKNNGYNNGQDFAYTDVVGSIAPYTHGSTTWNILTTTSSPVGNRIDNQVGLYIGMVVTWDLPGGKPCNPRNTYNYTANCTSTGGAEGPGVSGGPSAGSGGSNPTGLTLTGASHAGAAPGTYALGSATQLGTVSSRHFQFRFDTPADGGPWLRFAMSDVPLLHTGTFTISSGYVWDGWAFTKADRSGGTQPANMTFSHVISGDLGAQGTAYAHNQAEASFANGDPQIAIDAVPTSTWAAMSDAQVISTYVNMLLPKSGGPLDAGGGAWYGAFTSGGVWNDGSGKTPGP